MRLLPKTIGAIAASVALLASSTAAAASVPPAQAQQAGVPSAWVVLSTLSPSTDVAFGGAATAAVQPTDVPPPPPHAGPAITGELLTILLWFGLIAIALNTHEPSGRPNSPA